MALRTWLSIPKRPAVRVEREYEHQGGPGGRAVNTDCAEKSLLAKITDFLEIKTAYPSPKNSMAGILDDYF